MNYPYRFPVIMGPTASGKSALALSVAEKFGGEIISVDSMQLYCKLDKGTAKPSAEERKRVVHHLIDTLDLSERSDLFTFVQQANELADSLRERGKLPVLAGGTGLYLRGFLYGLDEMPSDQELRKQLDAEFDSPEGFERLKTIAAKETPEDCRLWSYNCRKLIRAREVYLLSGKEMSSLMKAWKNRPPRNDAEQFLLVWDREILKQRIFLRCGEMLKNGWIEETESLMKQGLFSSPTAHQALGYPIIRDMLEGHLKCSELQEKISVATWQFARRQLTWFRGQHKEAHILSMPATESKLVETISSICGLQQREK